MLRILLALPLLLIIVLFALSNVQPVRLGFWPTDYTIQVPVALAVLGAMGVAFLIGAIVLWISVVGARFRARRAEHAARLLEAQITELKAELAPLRARVAAMPAAEHGGALTVSSWRG
jgi:uncharacterized integral membrane protein